MNGRIERDFCSDIHLADMSRLAGLRRKRVKLTWVNWGPIVIFLGSALAVTIYVAGYYWRTR